MTIQPAIRSLVSANGPSVTGGLPVAVVPDEGALGRERLAVDELAALSQRVGEVAHERDVGGDLLGGPLVHRDVQFASAPGRRGSA